ncbi:methyltransferase [Sulfurovum sp.]|uniref:methyltransferase n=1 Tax=Sulfurovum sp. TaxID=1969726 RepID=UPI002867BA2A|nr:methyltransferase [Sulfurovum sp.]
MNKDLESIQPDRPSIITTEIEAISFYRKMDTKATVVEMIAGKYVLVEEFYSNGLQVLTELKRNLLLKHKDKSYQGQRDYRSAFREASHRLLLKVKDNKLIVKKSPDIGWLKLLYPDVSEFYVSFPEVQGMNSSWQWYEKGLEIKTLNLTLKPYYGTYFPTRFDHLKLFDKWLKTYNGPKNNAMDIGAGSGILSFQLIQNGFENIFATDSNRNAIIGVSKESERLGFEDKITLSYGDLFTDYKGKADVIIFNPPWLLAKHKLEEGIDKAMYYEEDLFPRFFEQAQKHLSPNGKIVLIFSNLAQEVDKESTHPIIEELQKNNRFRKELHLRRDVRASSRRTKRTDSRDNEKVELWVLGNIL